MYDCVTRIYVNFQYRIFIICSICTNANYTNDTLVARERESTIIHTLCRLGQSPGCKVSALHKPMPILYEPILYEPILYEPILYEPILYEPILYEHILYKHVLYEHVLYEHVL